MGSVAIALLTILVWPGERYDWNRVDSLVRNAPRPYRSVSVEYYLDGGSAGVLIVDAAGTELNLVLLVKQKAGQRCYERLGRLVHRNTFKGMLEMPLSIDTRNYLIQVIEQHRGANGDGHLALLALRGWPKDYLHFAGLIARLEIHRLGESIMRRGPM